MVSLFRPEVIEGRQQAWLGSIQLVRPVPLAVLTLLVLTIAVLTGAFLFEGRYTRKAHITGVLVPDRGVTKLVPPQAGVVKERYVVEGQSVRKDDVLFVLSIDRASLAGDTQAAVQQSLAARRSSLEASARRSTQLRQEQVTALERQIADMRAELVQLDAEAELHKQQLALKEADLAQYEALSQNENFVSPAHLRSKKADVLDVRAKLQALSLKRSMHEREIASLVARRREQPLLAQADLGGIERDIASLEEASAENEAKRHVVIRAPEDGVVTAVLAEKGTSVSTGSTLASLLPAQARLQAQLFAPSSAVGFVRPEQQVQLRYQAFPYQKFGHHAGQVMQVSRTPLQGAELAGLPLRESLKESASAEPLYRITVALDRQAVQAYGQAQPLVAGMQLEADVLLDRRRLIEWIFEPLISVTGRI
ncbi:MAG TPA: HlyD family efflux transporter periplasmic adaptor subunit [Albitalea sp.]|uniref:HlyD family secretion protein n=1 Tax=Piscinibacter sp. TaxID=1903157 RepID=UPI002ED33082